MSRLNPNIQNGFHVSLWSFFFGPAGTLTTAAGGTITPGEVLSPWPTFSPKEVMLSLVAGRSTVEAQGNVHATDVLTTDYNGAVKLVGASRSAGSGSLFDGELSQKTLRIPPTIHAALPVALPNMFQSAATSGSINGGSGNTALLTAAATVQGQVNGATSGSITIPATSGRSTIPTDGWFLYDFSFEPFKYDLLLLHFVIIDFSDIL